MRRWLERPETRGIPLDSPEMPRVRRDILARTPLLRRVYLDWYARIQRYVPPPPGRILEIGSGPGFLREVLPELIRSDILSCGGLDVLLDAIRLPFIDDALRAVVMTNVLHHLPDVEAFLRGASRCIRPGGALVMIEPWVTPWSRFVYRRLHHEPFDPGARAWRVGDGGPLSGANGALPWMLFERDRIELERAFPEWRVERVEPFMPFRYLMTGGFSMRTLAPRWLFTSCAFVELGLGSWMAQLAMFALLVVRRTGTVSR
jgi:SAM-dependent methyltransferase